jgi:SAM-dependent methyltransferase
VANDDEVKGWFKTKGRNGDRTLEQQLTGLEPLLAECAGKSILDIGCAEGLISIKLAKAGALFVRGVEIVPGHVSVANKLKGSLPCDFRVEDANHWAPTGEYDAVIALALLHKLRDPTAACIRFANACFNLMVIRLPPEHAPTILDERSGFKPHDIDHTMKVCGFELETVTRGHLNEWCGFYRRVRA